MDEVRPTSRAQWRAWLAKNHDTSRGCWVVYAKKGTDVPTLSYEESVLEALCYGWIDGLMKSIDETYYKRRFTPRKPKSTWSPSNKRRVSQLLEEGTMRPAGQALIDAAKADGSWDTPSEAERAAPVTDPTPEFQAALDANPRAKAGFDALTPGRRKVYCQWIAAAKRDATREKRIREALESLEEGQELGMK